jgi:hypothetical protein
MQQRVSENGAERVLVVVNEAIDAEQLRDKLVEHLGEGYVEVFLVAPALTDSAIKHHMGDVDDAIAPTRERLERSLQGLHEAGIDARGEVGDSDPLVAISDEVQKLHPDRIVVVAHREAQQRHAEQGLLKRVGRDFHQPVTELLVDAGGSQPRLVGVERAAPGAGRDAGERPSGNLPPLSRENLVGIAVAVIGTLVLGALAAACAAGDNSPDLEEGRLDGVCPILILIAVVAALINMAHVVGLLLFQSTRYEGLWQRFFARLSLFGTPLAVALSLVLYLQR